MATTKPKKAKKAKRANGLDLSAVIKILKKKARRPGTAAAKRYGLYRNGQTVSQYLEAGKNVGVKLGNVRADVKRGNIELVAPQDETRSATK